MNDELPDAASREELFLQAIATGDTTGLPVPASRIELWLNYIAEHGGGGGGAGFEARIVEELPQTGENGVIYLVANGGSTGNTYDEFIWIASASKFEKIGTTEITPPNVVQTTGQSTTDVMSQKAVTDLVGNVETLMATLISGGGAQ